MLRTPECDRTFWETQDLRLPLGVIKGNCANPKILTPSSFQRKYAFVDFHPVM